MSDAPYPTEVWDIWHARFDFSEGKGYKYRPVLVVGIREGAMLAAMITSKTNKLALPHNCLVSDWAEAGLEKPSIIRLDRIIEIPSEYVGAQRRIGRLTEKDIAAVIAVVKRL